MAHKLLQENDAKVHAEADKKMLNHKGEYVFNPKNLGAAHAGCVSDIAQGMKEGEHFLVVSNTATCYWEMYEYVRLALQHNYEIRFVEPETEWSKNAEALFEKNSHAVPIASIKNQLDNLAKNPTLPVKEMVPKILATMGCRPCSYRPGINITRFFSYGLTADKMANHIRKLKEHLGEEYNDYYKNLCSRDGGINEQVGGHVYHITLSAFEMEEDKYFADEKNRKSYGNSLKQIKSHPTFLGVGRVRKGEDVSYFVVAEWAEFALLRQSLSLKPLNLHVSLGFKPNDIHDIPKDKTTIFLN
uniref:Swiss Army Knife 2H phosphoesterase domain-containing protein n=1 Tax=Arcella intermedia TaxID=1963864 RepID=A0A6B2L9F1_9EUKA